MEKVLIDSDVVLDFYLKRAPFDKSAIEVFSRCANKIIQGHVTPVIISNVYYLFKQRAEHQIVIAEFKKLLRIVDVLSMDNETVNNSIYSDFTDFEDAL